jgi:ribose/xylose/arabinose/galactoside ABC-type transport system permease subunit
LAPFIVTLGMWGALRGAAKGLASEQMIIAPSTWLNRLLNTLSDTQRWMLLPPGVWLMLVLAVVVAIALRYARRGRYIFAVGSNEVAARICGVPVERTKLLVYTLGSGFAALAGVLQFSYLTVGDPTTATGMELDVIAAVVIGGGSLAGGEGSVLGSLVGALIMTVVGNGCTKLELPNWVQEIVTGAIIVVAVSLDRLRQRKKV